jgi:hypothetical protein
MKSNRPILVIGSYDFSVSKDALVGSLYDHNFYLFGINSDKIKDQKMSVFESVERAGLLIYIQTDVHNELNKLLRKTNTPMILVTTNVDMAKKAGATVVFLTP